jgi:hypothetical protein
MHAQQGAQFVLEGHLLGDGVPAPGTNDTYGIEIAPLHAPQPLRG